MGRGASAASIGADGARAGAVAHEEWNMEQKPDSWAFAVQVEFVACSAGAQEKGFSSSATLARMSICAQSTSQTR